MTNSFTLRLLAFVTFLVLVTMNCACAWIAPIQSNLIGGWRTLSTAAVNKFQIDRLARSKTMVRSSSSIIYRPRSTYTGRRQRMSFDDDYNNPDEIEVDNYGRRIRTSSSNYRRNGGESRRSRDEDRWDDFEPEENSDFVEDSRRHSRRSKPPRRNSGRNRNDYSDRFRRGTGNGGRNNFRRSRDDGNFGNRRSKGHQKKDDQQKARQINMNALEGAGFVHLYGLSSVLNALETNRREFTPLEDARPLNFDADDDTDSYYNFDLDEDEAPQRQHAERKPEAQFRPWLFVQSRDSRVGRGRAGSKTSTEDEVRRLADERGVPVAEVDKGVLNSLSGNRPHQGFVLRCGKLFFNSLGRIPHPKDDPRAPSLWLVLDEVIDPQNLGALLRSAFFLGGNAGYDGDDARIGVLVCSKNSAPPSPVVSASSAGALELLEIHSTSSLPRTLNNARADGFRIIGASSAVPRVGRDDFDLPPPSYELQHLPTANDDVDNRPILLVLGSEGHGLRTLVAKACTEFVRIPGGMASEDDESSAPSVAGVDSLNVSVTGGILLWHLLHGVKA